ncbi:1250_t:CDS:1, partial [Ambispora gerdemannii]
TVSPQSQLQIQLLENPNLFWAVNNDGKIVLSKQPIWWKIDPGSGYISVVNSDKRAQRAQFNDVDKQLTAVTDQEVEQNQRFMVISFHDDIVNITPRQNVTTCVTHKELNVVAELENPPCAQWKLIRRKS